MGIYYSLHDSGNVEYSSQDSMDLMEQSRQQVMARYVKFYEAMLGDENA